MLLDFFKAQLHLSSPLSLLAILAAGVIWLWRRPGSRDARLYLTAVVIGYWFAATPTGANVLVGGLSHGLTRVQTREDARGADAVVVLGGGALTARVGGIVAGTLTPVSLLRALEGVRVFKLIDGRILIASGGIPNPARQFRPESEILRNVMIQAGVAPAVIVEEPRSRTTREQALLVGPVLRMHHVNRFVLVTSPTHMRRSLAVFRAAGFDPVPSLAPLRSEGVPPSSWLLPNDAALWASDEAVYDYAAWVYYAVRGWMRPPNQ